MAKPEFQTEDYWYVQGLKNAKLMVQNSEFLSDMDKNCLLYNLQHRIDKVESSYKLEPYYPE